MARFDVYRLRSSQAKLVVDVQADILDHLTSRVVVPLRRRSRRDPGSFKRLTPLFEIEGETYVFLATDIGTLPVTALGELVTNIEDPYRDDITAALDFLFQGF